MRPLEWVLGLGAIWLLVRWALGRSMSRVAVAGLAVAMVAHVLIERQRATMWPIYAIIVMAALAVWLRPSAPAARPGRWNLIGRWTVALALLSTVVPLPWLLPVMKLPTPTGPYTVGTTTFVVVDSGRKERFATGSTYRDFPVRVWYPVQAGTTGTMAPYGKPAEMSFGAIPAIFFDQLRLVKTHSLKDAPIAPGSDRFPTLIFSHGYGGSSAQNTPQVEELASRGYVIFSIAHTGEAGATVFPDGRIVPMDTALMGVLKRQMGGDAAKQAAALMAAFGEAKTADDRTKALRDLIAASPEPLRSASLAEWTADTRALVNQLERNDRGDVPSPVAGRLDLDRLGVFGMSYGGATAGDFCRLDRRCKAGMNLDGGQYGGLIDDSLTVPFFIMASEPVYQAHLPVLDRTRGPAYLVRVPKTTHLGLTDMTLLAPVLFRWSGVTGRLDPARRERIMTDYLVAFFDTYLKGDRSALLNGPPADQPDILFISRNTP